MIREVTVCLGNSRITEEKRGRRFNPVRSRCWHAQKPVIFTSLARWLQDCGDRVSPKDNNTANTQCQIRKH